MSLAHIRLRISERFREAKDAWHANPAHHGKEEIPPPPPKKSMLDRARNSIARVAPNQNGPLALGGIPKKDPQEGVGPLLAVSRAGRKSTQNVKSTRFAELPQPPLGVCKDRSMGREESGQRLEAVS
jgi:hypothetical protein